MMPKGTVMGKQNGSLREGPDQVLPGFFGVTFLGGFICDLLRGLR